LIKRGGYGNPPLAESIIIYLAGEDLCALPHNRQLFAVHGSEVLAGPVIRTSASAVPKAVHVLGLKILSSETLCMHTGILRMDASVIRSAPIWP
jgi:hypothetical protein